MERFSALKPGLFVILAITACSFGLAQIGIVQHYGLGPLTLAILFGALLGNARPTLGSASLRPGLQFVQRHGLRAGVALYGFNLSAQQIVEVGARGVLIDLLVVISTLALGWFVGRHLLGMDRETVVLASAGSAICGAAAVLATTPMLNQEEDRVAAKSAVAVATVVLFGTLAMFLYPVIYAWIGSRYFDFGIYIGSTVHEVAQVVAISGTLGENIEHTAVIAKMIRVLLLVPALLTLGWLLTDKQDENRRQMPPIPWFAIAFIVLAGVNSLHIVPEALVVQLRLICTLLLTAAMAALGIDTTFLRMRQAGLRPIILGSTLFLHLIFVGGLFNWLLA